MKNKNVLVLGGAGYIGQVLCDTLALCGHEVTSFDINYYSHGVPNIKNIRGDIRKKEDLKKAFKNQNVIIHLAAIAQDYAYTINDKFITGINYEPLKLMSELIEPTQRFIFASSCSVYGRNNNILTEGGPTKPLYLYSKLKLKAEEYIKKHFEDYFILRKGTVFGVSRRLRLDIVVNILSAKAYFENKFKVFGGEQWRPLVWIEDVAEAYTKLVSAKHTGDTYNLGGYNYQIKNLIPIIEKHFRKSIGKLDSNITDTRSYKVSSDKFINDFDFEFGHVTEGIVDLRNVFIEGLITNHKDTKHYCIEHLKRRGIV